MATGVKMETSRPGLPNAPPGASSRRCQSGHRLSMRDSQRFASPSHLLAARDGTDAGQVREGLTWQMSATRKPADTLRARPGGWDGWQPDIRGRNRYE